MRPSVLQLRCLSPWSKTTATCFVVIFVSFWTWSWGRFSFTTARVCSCQSPFPAIGHQRARCKLHISASHSGSFFFFLLITWHPPAAQPCQVSTQRRWDLLRISDWNTCEAEWWIKLELAALLFSVSALAKCLLPSQKAWSELTVV